jgi:hypothetical protein
VLFRLEAEREKNPERLNLDKRQLTECPILDGEERLRLLNYQNNLITEIRNLGEVCSARQLTSMTSRKQTTSPISYFWIFITIS